MTKGKPTVDDYLLKVPKDQRDALEKLRKEIKAIVPDAVETISYHIPIFKYQGHFLVGFGAAKDHCTFHLMSISVMRVLKNDLKMYAVGKGSVQFQPDKPLPVSLVKKIVKARIAENAERFGKRARR